MVPVGWRGHDRTSGRGSNRSWGRCRSRLATSAARTAPSPLDTVRGRCRGCSAYPDTYEIGLPNQGLQILYEILNERDDASPNGRTRRGSTSTPLARTTCRCSRSTPTAPPASSTCSRSTSRPSSSTRTSSNDRPRRRAGAGRRPRPRASAGRHRRALRVQPRAARRLRRRRSCSARARRSSARSPRWSRAWKARAHADDPVSVLRELAHVPGVYVPSMYDVDYDGPAIAPSRRGTRTSRRPSTSARSPTSASGRTRSAARAAHRGRARPAERRGLPRLHPRLPLLPGRDDHPPGARAAGRAGAHDGRRRPAPHGLRRGQPHVAVDRRLQRHRGRRRRHPRRPAAAPGCTTVNLPSLRVDAFTVGLAGQVAAAAQRADVRPGGRLVADAVGHQQADHRGRPLRRRRGGLRRRAGRG